MVDRFEEGKWYRCVKDITSTGWISGTYYVQTSFWEGYIYQCRSGCLYSILGSNVPTDELGKNFFEPFDFELEDWLKRMIEKKKEYAIIDDITIIPYSTIPSNGKILYLCAIYLRKYIGNGCSISAYGATPKEAYEKAMRTFKFRSIVNNKLYLSFRRELYL